MNTFKKITLSLLLVGITSFVNAQDLVKKYYGGFDGFMLSRSYSKQEVIAKFGNPTKYRMEDNTIGGSGLDEEYIYEKELTINCTNGEIRKIWTNSPKYLFFNHIRVGDSINVC